MIGVRCICHDVTYTTVSAYLEDHEPEQLELNLDGSRSRHPSSRYVGTFRDGSQVFVEEHAPGVMTAAVRFDRSAVWGPPVPLDEAP